MDAGIGYPASPSHKRPAGLRPDRLCYELPYLSLEPICSLRRSPREVVAEPELLL